MEFLIAVQFLTKIPIKIQTGFDEKKLAKSMAFFSLVGILLGVFAAVVHHIASLIFSLTISNFLALVSLICITGNLHGDGLMDTADGVFSGRPRECILEIMKDSRVGSHGVTACVAFFLAKMLFLGELPGAMQTSALILAPALGRWSQVYGAAFYPYARREGGTASFTTFVGWREVLINSLVVILLSAYLLQTKTFILLAVIFIVTVILNRYFRKKIGGITGDTLGAVNECIEVLAAFVLIIIHSL